MKTWMKLCAIALLCLASPTHAESLQTIATNGVYAPMRPHGSGVYVAAAGASGKTFVTWAGPQLDVYVRAFDHASGQWEAPILVRNNNYTGTQAYHNYPVIARAPDGRLLISFFNHGAEGYLLRSPSADSASGTWSASLVLPASEDVAYPTLLTAGSTVYLFYRSATTVSTYNTLNFIKSSNSGVSWSAPQVIVDTGNAQGDNLNTIYPNEVGYEAARGPIPARIRIVWHLAGGDFHNQKSKNVYFAYLIVGGDTLQTANGTNLGAVIDSGDFASQDTTKLRVYTALPSGSVLQAVDAHMISAANFNQNSWPLVGFNFDGGSGNVPYTAYWNGSGWQVRRMTQDGVNIAGRLLDFQFVNNGTLRAIMGQGLMLRGKETTSWGANWSHEWELDAAPLAVGGADTFGFVNTVDVPGREVQALVGMFKDSTRKTDYSGQWPIIAIRD